MDWKTRHKAIVVTILMVFMTLIICGCKEDKNIVVSDDKQNADNMQNDYNTITLPEKMVEDILNDYTYSREQKEDWIFYECTQKSGSRYEDYGVLSVRLQCGIDVPQNFADTKAYMESIMEFEVLRHIQNIENDYGIKDMYEALRNEGQENTEYCYLINFENESCLICFSGKCNLLSDMTSGTVSQEDVYKETQKQVIQ